MTITFGICAEHKCIVDNPDGEDMDDEVIGLEETSEEKLVDEPIEQLLGHVIDDEVVKFEGVFTGGDNCSPTLVPEETLSGLISMSP